MFEPMDEILPVVTFGPSQNNVPKKKMRPILPANAHTDRCLQTLIYISAREKETRYFFKSILRIAVNARAMPNPLQKVSSVRFTAPCGGEDPTGWCSGAHRYW